MCVLKPWCVFVMSVIMVPTWVDASFVEDRALVMLIIAKSVSSRRRTGMDVVRSSI